MLTPVTGNPAGLLLDIRPDEITASFCEVQKRQIYFPVRDSIHTV
jgi:hypothetical protein